MAIKMIVADLDGTLLKTDKTISEYTKTILGKCRTSGIKIVYATGRGSSAERVAPPELFDGKITINGAVAIYQDSLIYHRLIPYQAARPILMACHQRGLRMASERNSMHYTNFKMPDEWADVVTSYKIVDFSRHAEDVEKIYTYNLTPDDVSFIQERLPCDLYMVTAIDGLAMIMHHEATKSKAVAALAQYWNIAHTEIVAFGDDLNDIDLLSYAGTSVAVSNALDEVKAVADYTCDTNDNDGVAKWLEKHMLHPISDHFHHLHHHNRSQGQSSGDSPLGESKRL